MIENENGISSGEWRSPRQMLKEQKYEGHKSLHDESIASDLGLAGAPIEGPTHFSQFVPLLHNHFGDQWFEKGCFSAHFKNMVVEGEQVKAFIKKEDSDSDTLNCWAEKKDGSVVLEASASLNPNGSSLLDKRMAKLRPFEQLNILKEYKVGMKGKQDELVVMQADQHFGQLYPFTLNDKLKVITESHDYYTEAEKTPWDKTIIPLEMVSVLGAYTSELAGFPSIENSIGLFADLEIKMINGPLFVGEEYLLRREIVALGESRRTEGFWTRSKFFDKDGETLKAEMLLHQAFFKSV